jgi:hypothetical protein
VTSRCASKLPEFAPEAEVEIRRVALTWEQCQELPEVTQVPCKDKDPRTSKYVADFGEFGWELDSMEPDDLARLIRSTVLEYRNDELRKEAVSEEEKNRERLRRTRVSR